MQIFWDNNGILRKGEDSRNRMEMNQMSRVIEKIRLILTVFIIFILSLGITCAAEGLNITALDVGQGLCVLIEDDGHYMLYDGGGRDTSSYVVSYLEKSGITTLDYIVASHYDEDHISGLIGALRVMECNTVLISGYEIDTPIYHSFMKALEASNADVIVPYQGEVFPFGNSEFTVVGPANYDDPIENNRSVAIKIEGESTSCLLCGDAESGEETDILNSGFDINSDIYVVSHHGSASSNTPEFLRAVLPSVAIISCGNRNKYGHPTEMVLSCLQSSGCAMYRTDLQNEILLKSESSGISANQMPCEDWTPGEVAATTQDNEPADLLDAQYICNENTKKFHYPDCKSVDKMSEKNKRYTKQNRDELIDAGYDPCGNCHP